MNQGFDAGGSHERERRPNTSPIRGRCRRQHHHRPYRHTIAQKVQSRADRLCARDICAADEDDPAWHLSQLRRYRKIDVAEVSHRDATRNVRQQSRERRVTLNVACHERT
ncbi:hypothetical protein [Amycolatopsis thermoflava]|uniref:hypothetical protein n=1 Tax=Amycolatopsis thermoflava TaxID=84480 RepID=UPI0037F75711